MKKWHFNLRTKMMIYFFVCVVIPIIGFGILLLALQQRNTEQFMVRTQETSVLQLSDRNFAVSSPSVTCTIWTAT